MAGITNINKLSEFTPEAKADLQRMLDIGGQSDGDDSGDSGDNNSPWESGSGNNSAQLKNAQCEANGIGSVATGTGSIANGNYSHAEGYSIANGIYSHAEGYSVTEAQYAHAEGGDSAARGIASHAEGNSEADGSYSHAEGNSHAGLGNDFDVENRGNGMHSEGNSNAYGSYSHSEGFVTTASGMATHVGGRYNYDLNSDVMLQPDSYGTYVEMIGNGTDYDDLSNARTLTWTGDESLAGSLTLGMGTNDEVTITASELKQLLALLYN